jgi:signal transduction histidine kinase/ActR/RegA family two-component response regulator
MRGFRPFFGRRPTAPVHAPSAAESIGTAVARPTGDRSPALASGQQSHRAAPLRRHSLRWRLPAFFCALIVAVLATFLWATYREVENTLVAAGRQRAGAGAQQVADILERSVKARLAEHDTLRADPELRAYLRNPTLATREAARKDIAPSRPFRRVELWNTAGSLVLEAATPRADSGAGPRFLPRGAPPVREGIGEMRAAGNTNFFDVVVEIRDGPSPTAPLVGYLRRFGSITSTPGGNVRRLIGDEATVKIGSFAGGVWTDFYSIVDAPPLTDTLSNGEDRRAADGRRWIGAFAAIEGSPWVVWVGFPRALIVAPTRPFMRRMMVLGLMFVAGGMVLVVMLGVRLTQPLHALARAAEEIAAGDYTQRVSTAGRDEIGRLSDAFNTMTDRIEEAHRALRESHDQTHFALAAARIGVWESHLATGRMSYSESMRSVLSLPAGSLPQTRDAFLALVHPDDRESVRHGLEGRGVDNEVFDVRCRALEPDGTIRWLEGRGRKKVDDAGRPVSVLGVSVDVTEQRELEAQFRQSQKMEAVGQLAGGIAHDFNNLLAAIMSYSELLLADLPSESTARSDVSEIHAAAARAAALTRQLLAYSRKQLLQPAVVDLATVAERVASMLSRLMGPDIELETRAPRERWAVLADPGQMEQVLVNLAVNARDAMPNGGRLSIDVINVSLPAGAFPWARTAGDYVVLSVTDTGTGMSQATQAKIFDPFFTTKEAGKGTGLGLSTVYGIVKQSGGHITVESELGRGTTFKVYFPRHSEAPHLAPPSSAGAALRASRRESGHECVLVIDDEAALRSAVARILTRQGYSVLEAGEPAIARQLAVEHPGAIDLILADIMLPGLNGRDLVDELLTVQPRARTLFMSGFSDDTVKLQGLLEEGAPFLAKPFALDDVVRKVRDVLARGKGSGAGVARAC